MILKNREDITSDVKYCAYNRQTHKYDVTFLNGSTYHCNYTTIEWLKNPKNINPAIVRITHGEREFFNIKEIFVFKASFTNFWRIRFSDGSERSYNERDLKIVTSCLNGVTAGNNFKYLKQLASVISLQTDDGVKLLSKQYENVDFVGNDTALAVYLNPNINKIKKQYNTEPIFPFGINSSQSKAVQNALTNQISVIQGPPGTGKTQTILNIIANLLVQGKSVQVVSNNNSATANILEKLSSSRYNMGFIVAPLGNSDNKTAFIANQNGQYPNINDWKISKEDEFLLCEQLCKKSQALNGIFTKRERLAEVNQELSALELEMKYFELYRVETDYPKDSLKMRKKLKSVSLMRLWHESQDFSERESPLSFWYKVKSFLFYGISDWKFYKNDISKIITLMQSLYYSTKQQELIAEKNSLERYLDTVNAAKTIDDFTDLSMKYLKGKLYEKYGGKSERKVFEEDDLWKNSWQVADEYPVILSTTHSSKSSLGRDFIYDYLIMDEASQVDVATGALALSCARNAVIVGDTKQLPNVVNEYMKERTDTIFKSFKIADGYNYAKNSFLKSICRIIPDVPQTLLREHYRCHPKIIEFCNQKFYHGDLLIMTEDRGENDVLVVYKTVVGNHERGHMNQRQIDVVCSEVMPKLHKDQIQDIGIIAPYNNQVNALQKGISTASIDIATVHKFQGREKDVIILTTVEDIISDFVNDPYLLNVAVSRAKKKLCIVVSGNEQPKEGNIADLISYIEYNNFEIIQSKIYSVFDYLYKQYTKSRIEYLKKHKRISEYDSENLMYGLIKDVLKDESFASLDVICRQPLNMLIRDPKILSDAECKYAMNSATHLDFLIYNRISKKPVLAIEVDGFNYHKEGTKQAERDKMKNHILELYKIPYIRFATNGSGEKEKLEEKLREVI